MSPPTKGMPKMFIIMEPVTEARMSWYVESESPSHFPAYLPRPAKELRSTMNGRLKLSLMNQSYVAFDYWVP